jgi:DNA invertase Pin-like site-specific DNA recombinase
MNDIHETPTNSGVAVAYIRTATAAQAGGRVGLERQRRVCEQHAHALGLRLGTIYADIGVSGLAEQRPALDQLLLDLACGDIEYVVTADPARLARNQELERRIYDRIGSHGVTLTMPEDDRPVTNRQEEV